MSGARKAKEEEGEKSKKIAINNKDSFPFSIIVRIRVILRFSRSLKVRPVKKTPSSGLLR